MHKAFVASFLAVSIAATAGCQSVNKQQLGTALGVAAGLAVGATMGKGSGQVAAAVVGAAVGGYIGNRIGSMLDERDRLALELRTKELLNSQQQAAASQPVAWQSAHSSASAQIVQGPEFQQSKPVEVKRVPQVQAVPQMKLIQAPYVTMKSSNVRAAPDMQAAKVGGLQPGTEFTAVGSTGEWILVGRKGVTVGYVHKSLVSPKAEAVAKQVKPSVNLDEMNVAADPETRSFDLDAIPSLASDRVAAQTACRPVTVSLRSANGEAAEEQSTFCKQGNGTWELI